MIKKVKIADLKFYEKNAKSHPEEQVEKIKKSIEKFGYRGGIKVMEDLTIIIGHGRILALQKLNWEEVEVEVIEDLKPEDIKAYRLADNKTAESDWLEIFLSQDMRELEKLNYDLSYTGFDNEELDRLLLSPKDIEDGFELPDGERSPFQQMTFTFSDDQADEVREAVKKMKQSKEFKEESEAFTNENSNGNALARIAEAYIGRG